MAMFSVQFTVKKDCYWSLCFVHYSNGPFKWPLGPFLDPVV